MRSGDDDVIRCEGEMISRNNEDGKMVRGYNVIF
jgi:hypothetical protein